MREEKWTGSVTITNYVEAQPKGIITPKKDQEKPHKTCTYQIVHLWVCKLAKQTYPERWVEYTEKEEPRKSVAFN